MFHLHHYEQYRYINRHCVGGWWFVINILLQFEVKSNDENQL